MMYGAEHAYGSYESFVLSTRISYPKALKEFIIAVQIPMAFL